MDDINKVQKKSNIINRIGILSLIFVLNLGCCPKDGIDRSYADQAYNLTLDTYDRSRQTPITQLDKESRLILVLHNGARVRSFKFTQNESTLNRFSFFFLLPEGDKDIVDSDIADVEVELIDYKNQSLHFSNLEKAPYQINDKPFVSQNKWDGFLCNLNPIDWILPQAHALSCKPKSGSKITYRPGYLFSLVLAPEDP